MVGNLRKDITLKGVSFSKLNMKKNPIFFRSPKPCATSNKLLTVDFFYFYFLLGNGAGGVKKNKLN